MNTRTLIISILAFSSITVSAQPWMQNMESRKKATEMGEFYTLQDAFNEYWLGKTIEKGKGWKQFKRWENFMNPRVYPEGQLNLPTYSILSPNDINPYADMASWASLGPDIVPELSYADRLSGAGRINTVAFHPTDENIMYTGAPSGGIWKTIDAGDTWTSLGDNLESLGVSDIAISPIDPDVIYIATGDGDSGDTYGSGILKSVDGGSSWNPTQFSLALSEEYYFRRLVMHPTNPDILYAASNEGLFSTDDGFQTYTKIRSGHFKDIEFHPTNPNIAYATQYSTRVNAEIIRIINDGTNVITKVLTGGLDLDVDAHRVEIAVSPASPDAVFAVASKKSNSGFYALYKSIDTGDNWTKIYDDSKLNLLGWNLDGSDVGGQGWYDLSIAVDPENEDIILIGGVNMWKSVNGGVDFSINNHWVGSGDVDYVHADHHMIAYSPLTKDVFSCNDGGIYKSANNGTDWIDLSDGLSILQVYKTSVSESNADLFLLGSQDNGSFMHQNGIWNEVTGGDGMECLVHPYNPDTLITSYYHGNFWRSTDGGEIFYSWGPSQERGDGAWVTPLLPSVVNPEHIFVAYKNIYKSENYGDTWIQISDGLTTGVNFNSIIVSPINEDYIYASTYTASFRTKNGGISWERISDDLPDASIMSIAVSPNNPEKIWLSLSGFLDGDKVYMSENAGDTWINYSEGLPNIPTNIIVSHINGNGGLYLGTDHGMYYRDHTKSQWEKFNNGLPNVVVNDIEFQESQSRIIIGTYGRGLWESSFYPESPTDIYGEIHPKKQYACLGETAKFYIEGVSASDSVVWNFNDESSLKALQTDTVEYTFTSSGIKDIYATIYLVDNSVEVSFKNFFEVKPEVDLLLGNTGISNYHAEDKVTLLASGANEYEWTSDVEIENPFSSSINISIRDTTTFYVTGQIGSCESTDSVTVDVIPGPENDNICSASPLQFGINGPFTNVDASTEINEPLPDTIGGCETQYSWCDENGLQNSVWFTYVAEESSTSFITKGFDNQIAIYDAVNCDSILEGHYTILAANDDYFSASEFYAAALDMVNLEIGKKYWIQIDGSAGGDEGEFNLWVYYTPLGTEEIETENKTEFNIFPNPSNGDVTIQYFSEGNSKVEVYDLNGRKVMEKTIHQSGFIKESLQIDAKGLYLLRITSSNWIHNSKLIIN